MGDTPWKRTDWNDIIDRVNDLCTNPDSGCTGIDPLDDVEADHIWSVDDVQQVRDKLTEICSDNQFNADLRLWKQDIIDEINDAISRGCCNTCCPSDETTTTIYTAPSLNVTVSVCQGSESTNLPVDVYGPTIASFINGLTVARKGLDYLGWAVFENSTTKLGVVRRWPCASGQVDLDGKIHYDVPSGSDYKVAAYSFSSFTWCEDINGWTDTNGVYHGVCTCKDYTEWGLRPDGSPSQDYYTNFHYTLELKCGSYGSNCS